MAETAFLRRRRVLIEDVRRDGQYLRTTWHPEANVFVVSTWNDDVCTGAVRVPAVAAAELIGLLADGLAGAAAATFEPAPAPPTSLPSARLLDRIRGWLHGRRGDGEQGGCEVVDIRWRRSA